jgi:CubicO group peptidase (beta-lactamase class C family)
MCWCQFLLLVALCALLLAGCGAYGVKVPSPLPTTSAAAGAAAEEAYLAGLAEHGALTGSVLIARGGQVLLSRGYGLADEASQAANTPETRFRIGSNTKQFTAAAILLLQEHGKLSVQDTVCKYIPDCPEAWRPMTLHHLLTHTSGIPDYINSPGFPALIGTPATPEELIARFRNWPLLFAPGTRWSYSNSGYTLLGYVIERVSGESYAQFLQDNIFGPLGMTNTSSDSNTPQPPAHATGYLSAGVQPVYLDMSEFYAAGALASTVEDMLRWD